MQQGKPYRAGQRWGFRCSLGEFEHTLVVGHVLDPDPLNLAEYEVYVRYNPRTGKWTPPGVDGVCLLLKGDSLDGSVTELIEENATLPHWWRYGQKEDLPGRPRTMTMLLCLGVDEGLHNVLRAEQQRDEGRRLIARASPHDEVLRQLAPWREEHKRRAWKPVTESADGPLTASKFSGTPWLLAGERWPVCDACRRPMQLFLQLSLSQLPKELRGRHGDGLLQFFDCANAGQGACTDGRGFLPFEGPKVVRIIEPHPTTGGARIPAPEGQFPARTIISWEPVDDYPDPAEHGELGLDYRYDFSRGTVQVFCSEPRVMFSNQDSNGLAEAISRAVGGDKLAGWPRWIQGVQYPTCPLCHERMELLFQLDSEDNLPYMFGDCGCGHITQCPEHKDVVTFAWACC